MAGQSVRIPTSLGKFTAWFSERGLTRLDFPTNRIAEIGTPGAAICLGRGSQGESAKPGWVKETVAALEQVLAGRQPRVFPPLDWSGATAFQREVWEQLRHIPPGRVLTYAEVARAIGRPEAARAVGGACGANPIPVLVPCHRVVAANGGLGGFSGGLDWKRLLLEREGVDEPRITLKG